MSTCLSSKVNDTGVGASYICTDQCLEQVVHISQKLYVVAQYTHYSQFEVIETTVITMRYNPKTGKKYFSTQGKWGNGNWYMGTFCASSLSKNVFFTKEDAIRNIIKREGQRT